MNCVFCKISNKELSSKTIYEDDLIVAFYDVQPMAPVHALVIPKKHISSLNEISTEDSALMAHLLNQIPQIAESLGLKESGYRVVNNCGSDGGQTVPHLHFHILGGHKLNMKFG